MDSLDSLHIEIASSTLGEVRALSVSIFADLKTNGFTPLDIIEYHKKKAVNGYLPMDFYEDVKKDIYKQFTTKYAQLLSEGFAFFKSCEVSGKGVPLDTYLQQGFLAYPIKVEERKDVLFSIIDLDGDGYVSKDDIKKFFHTYIHTFVAHLGFIPKTNLPAIKHADVTAKALMIIFNSTNMDLAMEDTFAKASVPNKLSKAEWDNWYNSGMKGLSNFIKLV